jgi:TPR repeat protein
MYASGDGVELDMDEAIKWLQKSADQGDEEAIKSLKRLQTNSNQE